MQDEPRHERRLSMLALVLALLPILYLASVGPMYGLNARGVISDSAWGVICQTVYRPLMSLDAETGFFETSVGKAYGAYILLFEP